VLAKRDSAAKKGTVAAAAPARPDYATLAGFSDEIIAARSGADWAEWVRRLDAFGGMEMPHRATAEHVKSAYGVPDWWTQAVTVGYERIRGLRAIGQRRGGSYETNKSKTLPVPISRLYAAFADEKQRKRWLPGAKLVVRKATKEKSMRITWEDGSSVDVGFYPKGTDKSMVALAHVKLPDRARADELKRYWSERLDALAELLGR
jgi:uncharacterized protein YndB with AHSA1/START domain